MCLFFGQVAELVDAHVSGACAERHAGSNPALATFRLCGEIGSTRGT